MNKAQFDYYSELIMMLLVVILIISAAITMKLNPHKYCMKKPKATIRSGL